jgi:hypothetical protein
MAHPSDAFPKDMYQLSGTNALTFTDKHIYAINNPTASAINATVKGSNYTYQSDAYKATSGNVTVAVQPGATVYGRFTSVTGAGLLCYVA